MKHFLAALLMMVAVGFAQSKAELSIVIRPLESTVKGSSVELEVRRTNLTPHVLHILGFNRAADFIYDVRRDGVLVPETEEARKLSEPRDMRYGGSMTFSDLPPHQTVTDKIGVSAYRDMSQPGKYTIQLRQGGVKSNIVTVTVEP